MYIIKKSDNENDITLLFMLLKNIEFDLTSEHHKKMCFFNDSALRKALLDILRMKQYFRKGLAWRFIKHLSLL
jgi:hypothetical protein